MAAIPSITNLVSSAQSLSNLILVSPQKNVGYQPQNAPTSDGSENTPPPKLLFHYEGEQSVALESDITDHFVEDNTAIQDQIALKPEMITTHGFIGELNDVTPEALVDLKIAAQKLIFVSAYTPALSVTAQNAYNAASQAYQTALNVKNSAVSAWASLTGIPSDSIIGSGSVTSVNGIEVAPNQNKQQIAFQQFYGYWRSRTLFTVQTPWAIFENMAIKSLRAIQEADTRVITDFEISFKAMRFASTTLSLRSTQTYQGRSANQNSKEVDLGAGNLGPDTAFNIGGA